MIKVLQVSDIPGKGKGVVTTRKYSKGEFICEYVGELLPYQEAKEREENISYSIDATVDVGQVGRMFNHSKKSANLMPQLVEVCGTPRVCFFAQNNIEPGEGLLYDYGDHSAAAKDAHPWLRL